MSGRVLAASPRSLDTLENGYSTAIETLKRPVTPFSIANLRTAYGLGTATAINSFKSKLAAAELMVRAGTSVVSIFDSNWDSHDDRDGTHVRNRMTSYVLAPLNTFLTRMVEDPTRNVTVVIMAEFGRSLPNSDHTGSLTATVIGKNVKQGSTGRTEVGTVTLAPNTPNVVGLWSYIAALTKVDQNPFGPNLHPTLIL